MLALDKEAIDNDRLDAPKDLLLHFETTYNRQSSEAFKFCSKIILSRPFSFAMLTSYL